MFQHELPCRFEAVTKRSHLLALTTALSLSSLLAAAQTNYSEAYTFTTLAGIAPIGSANGPGTDAQFNDPRGVAVDTNGDVFVADAGNNTIRMITSAGVVTTFAGFAGVAGSSDGTNDSARFNFPAGVALDSNGNLYVADYYNDTIRKVTPTGVVTTLAGSPGNAGTNDGMGTNAQFDGPSGVAVDSAGNIYVAEFGSPNNAIRKVTTAGMVTTLPAGGFEPYAVAVDSAGDVFSVNAGSGNIVEFTPAGTNWMVTTLAGGFFHPEGIAVDVESNLYVANSDDDTVSKVTPGGSVSTLAGVSGAPGNTDGTGSEALFNTPIGLALDSAGALYVADEGNNTIRKITTAALVNTVAGSGSTSQGSVNGAGNEARFNGPQAVAVDGAGNVYVADTFNDTIRTVTSAGVVNTIAGLAGMAGNSNGVGSDARFNLPQGVAVDGAGNIYVGDSGNGAIREVTPAGVVTTLAEGFGNPTGVALDSATNIYVADEGSNTVCKVTPAGTNWAVTILAGGFSHPSGVAVDSASNVYVADTGHSTICEVTPTGTNWVVTTLAGQLGQFGSADGTGTNAQFFLPRSVAVDNASNIYVADTFNNVIRKMTLNGGEWTVITIAGSDNAGGSADGTGFAARFDNPCGIAVDLAGNLYVADTTNNTIRKGVFQQFGATNPVPSIQPATNATLIVTLSPAAAVQAGAAWRFPWEQTWRASGAAATGLVPGQNYTVELSPVPGYLAVPSSMITSVSNGTTSLAGQYFPTGASVGSNSAGSLTVEFQANAPNGAGWRLLNSVNPGYLPSGYATNLAPGSYLIGFNLLSGYLSIPAVSVQIQPGASTVVQEIYQSAQGAPPGVLLPDQVTQAQVGDVTNYPFGYNGQLITDVGYGSGVAVDTNVVLTAAHMVFNSETLSYVNQAYWFLQEESNVFTPHPLQSGGFYVLSGYASAKTNDALGGLGPEASSAESRNFDVAAIYFSSSVAGGGFSGYLPSDAVSNTWLTSTAEKLLVGYPVDGSLFSNGPSITAGLMYEIGPQPYPLSPASDPVNEQQEVYTAGWFLSYPGNSGGPFYVQLNGTYYPAGVYLGSLFNGITPYASAVRAIDNNVVRLITNAQFAVTGGTNNSGGDTGGFAYSESFSFTTLGANNPGGVQVLLEPPAAVRAGAGWRLQGDSNYAPSVNFVEAVYTTNPVMVEFAPVAGYNAPTNQTVTVTAGQISQITADYTPLNPSPNQMEVVTVGEGTVSPNYSGQTLTPGHSYSMTARPLAGYIFAGWTGTVVTNTATLKFAFQTNMVEQADFVANPFPPYVGTYNGLFWSSNGVAESSAGMLKGLTVNPSGKYSGSLLLDGASKGLSGSFEADLQATNEPVF